MKTNLENYEERFVDYMEGQLTAEEMREVETFVAEHPELKEDFELFCSTKLKPDTSVVYAKKESLMRKGATIRPLYMRIVAAAACVALLIGLGVRFLKPHQELEKQPLMANLTPIEAQAIDSQLDDRGLRKSNINIVYISNALHKPQEDEITNSLDLIASIDPIAPKPLLWNGNNDEDGIESTMYVELGERLAMLEPFNDPEPLLQAFIVDQKEQVKTSLQSQLSGSIGQATKTLYKRTVKTIADLYYTADYRISEAKDQLMASR